jgi:hypothetical protein
MNEELDLEPAQILAMKAGLVRKCKSPACEEIIATGDSLEPEELQEWIEDQDGDENLASLDSPEAAAKAIQDAVDESPSECGCALGG